jgi:predicted F0F1-ATPase subunit
VSSNGEAPSPNKPEEQDTLPNSALSPSALRFWKQVASMTSVGWSTVLPIAGGVLLGHSLDQRTGTKYVWTVGLLVGGIMVAFYNLYHILTKEMNE